MFFGKKRQVARIESLIGQHTEIRGDIVFTGGLHVDGHVKGNILAEDEGALLTVSEQGEIEGEVRVPNIVLNGKVIGDVYAERRVELAGEARVVGNVYYHLLEMSMGAAVNGKLIHSDGKEKVALPHLEDQAGDEVKPK